LFKKIADNHETDSYATRMRRRRFEHFLGLLDAVPRPLTILDVGGTQGFWERMGFIDEPGVAITILNLEPQAVHHAQFYSVVGDATDLSAFADASFDVVFSNSVIEHVGDLRNQQRMAQEIRRVGRRYFLQTPNYYFPIEPHFFFLGFQWLPLDARAWLLHHFDLGWYKRQRTRAAARQEAAAVTLLKKGELLPLFPGAKLYCEKVLGLTKSFVVYHGWE
jgi:2-polyprenyl-3-methyl-5-hydroxy-6-metoxy-1,4-benzoquinol methylase